MTLDKAKDFDFPLWCFLENKTDCTEIEAKIQISWCTA